MANKTFTVAETYFLPMAHTTFTVTETYKVKATSISQVEEAISTDDFSSVELNTDKRSIKIEPNF